MQDKVNVRKSSTFSNYISAECYLNGYSILNNIIVVTNSLIYEHTHKKKKKKKKKEKKKVLLWVKSTFD